jgi:hypothetical protein
MAGWFDRVRRTVRRLAGRGNLAPATFPPLAPPPAAPEGMTETRWLAASDPDVLLAHLGEGASERKLRLFAAACCRPLAKLIDEGWAEASVWVAERCADGLASLEELQDRQEEAAEAWDEAADAQIYGQPQALALTSAARAVLEAVSDDSPDAVRAANEAAQAVAAFALLGELPSGDRRIGDPYRRERFRQCALLRELFGNPFRPFAVDPTWLAFDDGCVPNLARAIYEHQSWDEMPVLGDALEEAGCPDEAALWHCRHAQGHLRGCWVLDALLGKS